MEKVYVLKHKDIDVLHFAAIFDQDSSFRGFYVISVENVQFLPIELHIVGVEKFFEDRALFNFWLKSWIRERASQQNRISYGLDFLRPSFTCLNFLDLTCVLSLNDSYWIVQETLSTTLHWKDLSLYEHDFDKRLQEYAFLPYDKQTLNLKELCESHQHPQYLSPEPTTHGMLKKVWIRDSNSIYLLKGSVTPTRLTADGVLVGGKDAYTEYLMSQLAEFLNFPSISYDLVQHSNEITSSCKLFTSENLSFVEFSRIVDAHNAYFQYEGYKDASQNQNKIKNSKLDSKLLNLIESAGIAEDFSKICFFDSVICNTDRHFRNFGLLVDSTTNSVVSAFPIFDNGFGFSNTFSDSICSAKYKTPAYPISTAGMSFDQLFKFSSQKFDTANLLNNLKDFSFKNHLIYKISDEILSHCDNFVQNRIQALLKIA